MTGTVERTADGVHARVERGWLVIERDGEWWNGSRFPLTTVGCITYDAGDFVPWVEVDSVAGPYRWYGDAGRLHAEIIGALTVEINGATVAQLAGRIVAAIAAWWKENIRWNSNWC